MSTKLKLLGVDVASFGDAFAHARRARTSSASSTPAPPSTRSWCCRPTASTCWAACWSATPPRYGELLQIAQNQIVLPPAPEDADPAGGSAAASPRAPAWPRCPTARRSARATTSARARSARAIREQKLTAVGAVKSCTKAGTTCGSCVPLVTELLKVEMKRAGLAVSNHLCEHFPHSRQELYHLVRFHKHKTFDAALTAHGRGRGCEICKPAVASILASAWNEHVHGAASTGRCRTPTTASWPTSSATARIRSSRACPAGEITPDQLIAHRAHRRNVRPLHQDHRRASASTCSARASSSCPTSGASWSPPASNRATPTARRCAR